MKSSLLRHLGLAAGVCVILSAAPTAHSQVLLAPRVLNIDPGPTSSAGLWVVDQLGLQHLNVTFNEPVTIPANAVTVRTVGGGPVADFSTSYDDALNTLTISFAPAIVADRVTVLLDFSITDTTGNALDGEIGDPGNPLLPSGNGFQGGQAVFRFNVLQGDVNRDGIVDAADGTALLTAIGNCFGDEGYDPEADLNGDGCINVLDVSIYMDGVGGTLPEVDGTAPMVTSITRDPGEVITDDLTTVGLTFSEPIDSETFSDHSCYIVNPDGDLLLASTASLAPSGLTASFGFRPALPQCDLYSVNISNALSDGSGMLLDAPGSPPLLSGLVQPVVPTINPHPGLVMGKAVTISGSAPGSVSVQITSPAGTITASGPGGSFSAAVPLHPNAMNMIFVSGVSPCGVLSAPATTAVTVDNEPPTVNILSPADGITVTTPLIVVSGNVGDLLTGQMGLSVAVNGVQAIVDPGIGTNGTFVAQNVPLTLGDNVIEAVASDVVGNTATHSVTVTRVPLPTGVPTMQVMSGDMQKGIVDTLLINPIVVGVLRADGSPFPNKVVTFHVTRSDGRLSATPGGSPTGPDPLTFQTLTDAQGLARAYWTLGSDAGTGSNRVEAVSNGVAGSVFFVASALPGPASRVVISGNNNQKAQVSAPLPAPFVVRVNDGQNPVEGVPVTFTVTAGGGVFAGGTSTAVVITGDSGSAQVNFTLGPDAGINRVEAEIKGNTSLPAVFSAMGVAPGLPSEPTSFSGLVLDNALRPLGGAECTLKVAGTAYPTVLTDENGRFTIDDITSGPGDLLVRGSTATTLAGAAIPTGTFPSLHFENFIVVPNTANSLPMPIMLPEMFAANQRFYSTTQQTILGVEGFEGLRMIIEPGSMHMPNGQPAPAGTPISLNQVHFDEIPMPLPDGVSAPFAWTLQPGGSTFDPPIRIEMPNMTALPPGAVTYFLSFNHGTGRFEIIGTGAVTSDGSLIVSDEGSGIGIAGWGGFSPPPLPTYSATHEALLLRVSDVFNQIVLDWLASNPRCLPVCPPGIPKDQFREYGAWIIEDAFGDLRVESWPPGDPCRDFCRLNPGGFPDGLPDLKRFEKVVGYYHIHPEGVDEDGFPYWETSPSETDLMGLENVYSALDFLEFDLSSFVGGYALASDGVWFYDADGNIYQLYDVPIWYYTPPAQQLQGPAGDPSDPGSSADTRSPVVCILPPYGTPVPDYSDSVLDERAVAMLGSASVAVDEWGSFVISNVPVTGGPMRVTIVADRPGGSLYAASSFFDPVPDSIQIIDEQLLLSSLIIQTPVSLQATPDNPFLIRPGQSTSLDIIGLMSDGSRQTLSTFDDGTWYQSSNPAITTVSASGLITAQAAGTVFITASNQGVSTTRRVDVTSEIVATDVVGFAQLEDGTPVADAVVVSALGGRAVTQPDGLFILNVLVPSDAVSLGLTAIATIQGITYTGSALVSSIVPGGITDGGILVMTAGGRPTCDQLDWLPTFGGATGMNSTIDALTVFDDASGGGPALYAGGRFTSAGGVAVNRIAKWNGTSWSALGTGMNSIVYALAVFDDGSGGGSALYAGGLFTTAGGVTANFIAKWNGTSWSALGSGMSGGTFTAVYGLTVFDDGSGGGPALYAGGDFTSAGGVAANRVAKWNGTSWSALGSGMEDATVFALTVFDDGSGSGPALYAGGQFTTAGGAAANRIAKWNGTSWSALGSGMSGFGSSTLVSSLTVFDDGTSGGPALYAGGFFTTAGGAAATHIAKWNGTSWSALSSGMTFGGVGALAVFDDGTGGGPALYAGGGFGTAGGVAASGIAKWNGTSWSALGSGVNNFLRALTGFDDGTGGGPALFAGGDFTTAGDVAANRIAKWNSESWSTLGSGMNDPVRALAVFDDGSGGGPALYAGGSFSTAGGVTVNGIAKWNGISWSALGSGVSGSVYSLAVFDDGTGGGPALYAAGAFTTAGGVTTIFIAKWNGTTWSALGSGMNNVVNALTVFDDGTGGGPALYAGGAFTTAGGAAASRIAKWNGTSWSALDSGISGFGSSTLVNSLTVFDDGTGGGPALYAGGFFNTAGGAAANFIAKWNGASWSALGSGMNGAVNALTVLEDGTGGGPALFAGGQFTTAGGMAASRIAKWNGQSWIALGSGVNSIVHALTGFDDGSGGGPALYAGGEFIAAGGVTVNHIAKWNGTSWSALGSGVNGSVFALAVFDDGTGGGPALYAGGLFTISSAGDSFLATWGCAASSVAAVHAAPNYPPARRDKVGAFEWPVEHQTSAQRPRGAGSSTSSDETTSVRSLPRPADSTLGKERSIVDLRSHNQTDQSGAALDKGSNATNINDELSEGSREFVAALGSCAGDPAFDRKFDVNGDACINALDVQRLTPFGGAAEPEGGVAGGQAEVVLVEDQLTLADPGETVSVLIKLLNNQTPLFGYSLAVRAVPAGPATGTVTASVPLTSFFPRQHLILADPQGAPLDPMFSVIIPWGTSGVFINADTADGSTVHAVTDVNDVLAQVVFNVSPDAFGRFDLEFGPATALSDGAGFAVDYLFCGGSIVVGQFQSPPSDLNGDGVVNTLDLGILLSSWSIPPSAEGCGGAAVCPSDLNCDHLVNTLDLGTLLASWTL